MLLPAANLLSRLRAAAGGGKDLSHLSDWLRQHTSHPKQISRPWSFKHHEMQIKICNETHHHVKVRKCSQIGLSEVQVRITLAMLALFSGFTGIYTLPTAKFAGKFTKARIDPIIESSKTLKAMVPTGADSNELKRLGLSFLYIVGTTGSSSPISIPADILIRDEVDFSDQSILSKFFSRLGHAEDGGWIRDFSTPTVDDYGISQGFNATTLNRYMVLCDCCGEWVAPDPLEDLIIPGFDRNLIELDREDLADPRYNIDETYVRCPACSDPLTLNNLLDPEKRQWVEMNPGAEIAGYQIVPFDVPAFNPPAKTIRSLKQYDRKCDWVNFELGYPYSDAENSFVINTVNACTTLTWVRPAAYAAMGCLMGVDIGKTSWVMIGKPMGSRKIDIIHAERIRQDGDNALVKRILELIQYFGVVRTIIDAAPDFSTAMQVISSTYVGLAYGCYYVHKSRTAFSNLDVKEDDQVVSASRTGTLTESAGRVNKGLIHWADMPEMGVIKEHLSNMNRISKKDSEGEMLQTWISKGPDHYAHALNYVCIASQLCEYLGRFGAVNAPPTMVKAKFGKSMNESQEATLATLR